MTLSAQGWLPGGIVGGIIGRIVGGIAGGNVGGIVGILVGVLVGGLSRLAFADDLDPRVIHGYSGLSLMESVPLERGFQ